MAQVWEERIYQDGKLYNTLYFDHMDDFWRMIRGPQEGNEQVYANWKGGRGWAKTWYIDGSGIRWTLEFKKVEEPDGKAHRRRAWRNPHRTWAVVFKPTPTRRGGSHLIGAETKREAEVKAEARWPGKVSRVVEASSHQRWRGAREEKLRRRGVMPMAVLVLAYRGRDMSGVSGRGPLELNVVKSVFTAKPKQSPESFRRRLAAQLPAMREDLEASLSIPSQGKVFLYEFESAWPLQEDREALAWRLFASGAPWTLVYQEDRTREEMQQARQARRQARGKKNPNFAARTVRRILKKRGPTPTSMIILEAWDDGVSKLQVLTAIKQMRDANVIQAVGESTRPNEWIWDLAGPLQAKRNGGWQDYKVTFSVGWRGGKPAYQTVIVKARSEAEADKKARAELAPFAQGTPEIRIASDNPWALVGRIALQLAIPIAQNVSQRTWKRLMAMSVEERADWIQATALKTSWLGGPFGRIMAGVGRRFGKGARRKVALWAAEAMTDPKVQQAALQAAEAGAAAYQAEKSKKIAVAAKIRANTARRNGGSVLSPSQVKSHYLDYYDGDPASLQSPGYTLAMRDASSDRTPSALTRAMTKAAEWNLQTEVLVWFYKAKARGEDDAVAAWSALGEWDMG